MATERMKHLLIGIQEDLEHGLTPLNHAFLVDNEVTLDEVFDLMDQISLAITVYLGLFVQPLNTQLVGTILGTGLFEQNRLRRVT